MTCQVLEFKKAKKKVTEPHQCGEAFCIGCGATWAAAVPAGITELECPTCGTHKGKFKFLCSPPEGTLVSECKCGNQLFTLMPEGHMCVNCGIYIEY